MDDNGKLWRIIPGVATRGEKLGRFLLLLKYSRLFLSCTCRNVSIFMSMNKTTCCYFLDDVVLVFWYVCVCVCVCVYIHTHTHTRLVTWYHVEFIYIYWNPSLFQTSRVRACARVCVQICIRISPSAEMTWSEQEVSELPRSKVSLNQCILHRESCDKISVITNLLCVQRLSGDRFVYKSSWWQNECRFLRKSWLEETAWKSTRRGHDDIKMGLKTRRDWTALRMRSGGRLPLRTIWKLQVT
jgi:hypothetical protein